MNSSVSNLIERTISQSHSQVFAKTYRGIEEEIIARINNYRLKISHVKDKLEEIIKESSNPEDHTITIKEFNKVIHYGSQENLDKLRNYLNYLCELKHTVPDFFHTPYLNSVFTRNFSSVIDSQKGLLQKSNESNEKLKKLLPSRNYHGIYIPNTDFKDIELLICFIVLEEFFMLSSNNARLRSDNLVIEANNDEMPQDISIFNPSFNTLMVYAAEREQHLYLLFLTDVLELMGPDNAEFPFMSRAELHEVTKKSRFTKTIPKLDETEDIKQDIKGGKKYENLKSSLPDMSLDQVQRFVLLLDNDNDFRININNVLEIVKKNKLVWDDSVVTNMFEEIFQRRSVIVETQRRNPVDAHEIFHAIRYKYKKDYDSQRWIPSTRPHRDQWLTVFKLVGIELPKYTLPDLKPKPILCNFEASVGLNKTQKLTDQENKISIKNRKPEILKKQYKPEANILIQNTQNIQELYIDDREHAKHEDSNKGAFQTLVNAKFKDLTQKTEYQTIEFSTQGYYKESLRLSKDPALYINEKVNPIYKFVPVKSGYVYQQQQELESIRDTRSAYQADEAEFDDSIEPNPGSKRVTIISIKDPQKMYKSTKSLRQTPTPKANDVRILGSHTRATTLSSSIKQRTHSPQNSKSKRPIFLTSFKTPDNETIRMNIAKMEPILDSYNPPKNHMFRSDSAPENKPPFMFTWQKDIPDFNKAPEENEASARTALEQEMIEREMYERRLYNLHKNDKQWTRYFKLAPRERGFVDHKYPEFLQKGSYVDGNVKTAPFVRGETETDVPFKLFHRSLRKTDKNQSFGEDLPTKH